MSPIQWHDLPPDYSRGTVDGRDRYLVQAASFEGFHGLEVLQLTARAGDRLLGYERTMRGAKRIAEDHEASLGGSSGASEDSRRPWPKPRSAAEALYEAGGDPSAMGEDRPRKLHRWDIPLDEKNGGRWVDAPLMGEWMSAYLQAPAEGGGYWVQFDPDSPFRWVPKIRERGRGPHGTQRGYEANEDSRILQFDPHTPWVLMGFRPGGGLPKTLARYRSQSEAAQALRSELRIEGNAHLQDRYAWVVDYAGSQKDLDRIAKKSMPREQQREIARVQLDVFFRHGYAAENGESWPGREAYKRGHEASEAGPGGALDWHQEGDSWVAPALGGNYVVTPINSEYQVWFLPHSKDDEAPMIGHSSTLGGAYQLAAAYENEKSGGGSRRAAEDYVAVDATGSKVGGPYKSYSDANTEAKKHSGYVKWVGEASTPAAAETLQPRADVPVVREAAEAPATVVHEAPKAPDGAKPIKGTYYVRWRENGRGWLWMNIQSGATSKRASVKESACVAAAKRHAASEAKLGVSGEDFSTRDAALAKAYVEGARMTDNAHVYTPMDDGKFLKRHVYHLGHGYHLELKGKIVDSVRPPTYPINADGTVVYADAGAAENSGIRYRPAANRQYYVTPNEHAVHVTPEGRVRPVKNLGWLVKHWKEVDRFVVVKAPSEFQPMTDAILVAHLRDGGRYESTFASKDLLKDWLHRPVFRGLPVDWFGERTVAEASEAHVTTAQRNRLSPSAFALPKARKLLLTDKNGKVNAGHVKAAAGRLSMMRNDGSLSRAEYATAHKRIVSAGKRAGVSVREVNECGKRGVAFEANLQLIKGDKRNKDAPWHHWGDFKRSYAAALLWSTNDESDTRSGVPLDEKYSLDNLAPSTVAAIEEDCDRFQKENDKLLQDAYATGNYTPSSAGYDFALTRNHAGVGYWDRDLGDVGDKLTKAAHAYGEFQLYVGGDEIYAVGHERDGRHGMHVVKESGEAAEDRGGFAIAKRDVEAVRAGRDVGKLDNPVAVYHFVHSRVNDLSQEAYITIPLSIYAEPLDPNPFLIAFGQRDRVSVAVEDCIRPVIQTNAAGVIYLHQHPSGASAPSPADKQLTKDLEEAMAASCPTVALCDSLVIGDGEVTSILTGKTYKIAKD